jgi:hypothetical protein
MSKTYILRNDQDLWNFAKRMREASITKPLKVKVEVYRKQRSLAQNALMWMWYHEIQKHLQVTTGEWYSDDDIHEFFKRKFLPIRVVRIGNEIKRVRPSTRKLSTMEMSDYLNSIDMYCSTELELNLTHPSIYQEAMG